VIVWLRGGEEVTMTFTIHASKDGLILQTIRIDPEIAVAKALALMDTGWEVHVTDPAGQQYRPETFDGLRSSSSGAHPSRRDLAAAALAAK
jgi:hypothetical protein